MSTAKEIIEKVKYITIATVDADGNPWNAPVFTAYDKDNNFYWGSHIKSQHSINIQNKNKVFLVIYDSTIPAGEGEGVYIKAKATMLEDDSEISEAHKLLEDRHIVSYWKLKDVQKGSPVRLYKAVPEKVWMNSEGEAEGIYIDTRTEASI